jgi:hypothetical protein
MGSTGWSKEFLCLGRNGRLDLRLMKLETSLLIEL